MYENFPYSNFHDLNTDWLIDRVKNVETSEANAKASEENAKASELNASLSDASAQTWALQANNSAKRAGEQAQASAQSATEAAETVENTAAQVALLQSRVDNIIPSGTQTEGNTELLDIRVGYNGVTYPSAGDAVRTQAKNLHSEISVLNDYTANMYLFKLNAVNNYKGINASLDDNYIYNITGTATNDFTLALSNEGFTPRVGNKYKIIFDYTESPDNECYLYVYNINGSSEWVKTDYTFTAETDNPVYIKLFVKANKTANLACRPVILKYEISNPEINDNFQNINSDLTNIDNNLTDINNSFIKKPKYSDITNDLSWTRGEFWFNGVQSYSQLAWARVGNVIKGDTFKITARALGNGYVLVLADENNHNLQTFGPDGGYVNDQVYTMDYNGILYTNTHVENLDNSTYKLEKLTGYDYLPQTSMKDVKWVTIGDSLNDFAVLSDNWIRNMVDATGADITNLALSGTGFYRTSDYTTPTNYATRISLIPSDTELITIAGSFNDLMSSPTPTIPVGTATDTGTDTIAGWMNAFFDSLLNAFPHTPIGVYMTSPWDRYHYGSTQSDAYVSVLKEICLIRGIPFNDDCYFGSLRPWDENNRNYYYDSDGVHPNEKGHMIIYQRLKKFIESLPCNAQ